MLHGTRSHPTQIFSSLFNRLANVLTTNGFCYCVDPLDCQILHTDAANRVRACSSACCMLSSLFWDVYMCGRST